MRQDLPVVLDLCKTGIVQRLSSKSEGRCRVLDLCKTGIVQRVKILMIFCDIVMILLIYLEKKKKW